MELRVKFSQTPPVPPPAVDPFTIQQPIFESSIAPFKSKKSQSTTTPGMIKDWIYVIEEANVSPAINGAVSSQATYSAGGDCSDFSNNVAILIKNLLKQYINDLLNSGVTYDSLQKITEMNVNVMTAITQLSSLKSMALDATPSITAGEMCCMNLSNAIKTSVEQFSITIDNPTYNNAYTLVETAKTNANLMLSTAGTIIIMSFMKPNLNKTANNLLILCDVMSQIIKTKSESGNTEVILKQCDSLLDQVS
jgi:hypothetical protein